MTDLLIKKLQSLEETLRDVRKRYHIQYTELKKFKSRPQVDVTQLNQLKLQMAEMKNAHSSVIQERDNLKQKLQTLETTKQMLDTKYSDLQQKHADLEEAHAQMVDDIETLHRDKAVLQEKNRAAAASTKVVLERLTQIDNMTE